MLRGSGVSSEQTPCTCPQECNCFQGDRGFQVTLPEVCPFFKTQPQTSTSSVPLGAHPEDGLSVDLPVRDDRSMGLSIMGDLLDGDGLPVDLPMMNDLPVGDLSVGLPMMDDLPVRDDLSDYLKTLKGLFVGCSDADCAAEAASAGYSGALASKANPVPDPSAEQIARGLASIRPRPEQAATNSFASSKRRRIIA